MSSRAFSPADLSAARSWPFQEARALVKRLERMKAPADRPVVFETGYGPSGPPHIGTFGEVARTTMVRRAFEALTGRPSRLVCFSDDMDGMRKVPPHLPNQALLEKHLQMPLTSVPDPFDAEHSSFAHHNNAMLRKFLDQFGFEYEFLSATECYRSGKFDETLIRVLERYDAVMEIILPTLGEERRATYSPILPISPSSGRVLYVPMLEIDPKAGEVLFEDEDGTKVKTPVTGGRAKLQWKADWAGRWFALGVDYEMAGEDLTESVRLSSRIVRALGGEPPAGFNYQLFLDENGKKISKTKGNGITIEEWLAYASPESLSLYMFHNPKAAKKLYFDVIPKVADEYLTWLQKYPSQEGAAALDNPVWHIHEGDPPTDISPVSFALLLNLVNATGTGDPEILRGFVAKYRPNASPEALAAAEKLIGYAARYYEDFVKPKKLYRAPSEQERAALAALSARLKEIGEGAEEEVYHTAAFDAGKANGFEKNIRDWFKGLYEVLFGQPEGPRMGPFVRIYGTANTAKLIDEALAR
ncbi:lysine--tRNA ligase [Amphiplicatus metriothermophilus]|uniref:Lysine--tRNA ligase n=1 Tax=Amphiplicatus metriothermophilus TaxID=1519374 RepID=A0A239PKQ1_9PROT|nr:lysine--tRNA ligase [Amphiplicatus metriothermophilus]MBB5517273.1 lysyl-tRNA synthetase class 1 [Amphiplicatus metriothermophilus]SNT68391.1 lysyl-tRNA synthetase, class I [Amphiplicatus metriothermophilus]